MSKITGNEPAFPNAANEDGMTIRQHFASLALKGLLSNPHEDVINLPNLERAAVRHADDLIKELNNTK